MANTPISGLPSGAPVSDTDEFADVQVAGVGPSKVTAAQLKTYIGSSPNLSAPVISNPVTINGIAYSFPLTNGPLNSVLLNDGVGGLSWSASPFGSVSSIDITTAGTGLTSIGGPITSSGTITIGGTLNVAHGGTGATTAAQALINLLPTTSPLTASYALFNDGAGNFYWAAAGAGPSAGVLTWDAGATGFTPSTATVGNVSLGGVLNIAHGGTGQTTAAGAINAILPPQAGNAGLVLATDGSVASWQTTGTGTVSSIDVSGGTTGMSFSGGPVTASGTMIMSGTLAVANGGTGQVTANDALNAFLPSQAGNSGKFLTSNGTNASWTAFGPAGASTQIQFNSAGSFAGSSTLTWNNASGTIRLGSGAGIGASAGSVAITGANGNALTISAPASNSAYTLTLPGTSATPVPGEKQALSVVAAGGTLSWESFVHSVAVSGGTTGLTASGGPITSSGTITLGGILTEANGGTGQSSYAIGDMLYASGATTLSKLSAGAAAQFLRSNGTGTAPSWQTMSRGLFWDTSASQTIPSNLVSLPVNFGASDPANYGFAVGGGNLIAFNNAGSYQVQFSIQFANSDTAVHHAYVWLRKNGVDIANSATVYAIPMAVTGIGAYEGSLTASSSWIVNMAANDYLQIVWAVDNTSVYIRSLPAVVAPVIPIAPGTILTISQIS